ncbi:MAG: hypothetical protein JKX98_06865 [Alcanivoracaceae bacterium]|nr:hypothetical protein [Alcanivoracaceae bacterium]
MKKINLIIILLLLSVTVNAVEGDGASNDPTTSNASSAANILVCQIPNESDAEAPNSDQIEAALYCAAVSETTDNDG